LYGQTNVNSLKSQQANCLAKVFWPLGVVLHGPLCQVSI
jgi:hypothetical protein